MGHDAMCSYSSARVTEHAPTIRGLKRESLYETKREFLLWVTEHAPTIRGLKPICSFIFRLPIPA